MVLMTMAGVKAQTNNRIVIPDVTVQLGQTQLPVNIENTDEIVAAQFDLTLPTGMTAEAVGTLSNRGDDHLVTVRSMGGQRWRVLLYSPQNRPLKGQSGVVMYIPITIPTSYAEGSEHQLIVSDATLSNIKTENVMTSIEVGKVTITKLPDLIAKNITADKETLTPGENVVVSWQVENIGGLATSGGWSEQISLVSNDGFTTKLLATTYYDNTLESKAVVSRQAEITVPMLLGIQSKGRLQVRIIAGESTGESTSAQANNTQKGDVLLNVEKKLSFELQPSRVQENAGTRITAKLNRSGSWAEEQTYTLTATEDSRITVPASVTIKAGQSGNVFYINVIDNNVLDEDSVVTITASGNNYPSATGKLIIVDNEYPDLTLTASKSILTEGETFQLTVTTSRVSDKPITVTLASETAKRFSFPAQATIEAGETSVTVDVTATDDELPSLDLSNAFTASAPNHNKAEVIVVLKDNDLPVLELQVTPNTVQESAGPIAVAGILRRTTKTNTKITVKLTDDANGGLYFGNRTLELAKGVEEVHFNFGPTDNANVDGDRTYNITAAVWLSSCSCGASGESAGYVTAQLQVLDNDGPALNLASSLSTVKEGGKTKLTVTRNTTDNSAPLTVTLNSDYEEGLVYEHNVTIPTGQQSTTVEVTSESNSVQGDSHTVIFTVQAEGYSKGTCFVMITDQTLPDARISSITTDATEAEVGTQVKLTMEIINDGAAELPAEVPVKVYHRGESAAITTLYTPNALGIGESLEVTSTITLPTSVGNHYYYAVVNESNKTNELSFTNNTSADAVIKVITPFSVSVSTDKKIYMQGDKVIITGQLTGNGTANAMVDLYVMNGGSRQAERITTDENGAFSYEWQLYELQSGHFSIGACYPDERLKTEMATFDVYGLQRNFSGHITCEVAHQDTYNGQVGFSNPGILSLTGVKAEILSAPNNCEAHVQIPETIEGGTTAQLSYSLKGTEVSAERKWDEVNVRITSNEGVTQDVTLYFYCYNNRAQLVANIQRLTTTITKGTTRDIPLQIVNTGKGASGNITLSLPEWMNCESGTSIASLNQNDTATVVLRLKTNDKMQLNVPVTGTFGISCTNGNGLSISYSVEAVSEEKGMLQVDVCDEYTYNTSEAPHVAGAEVVVKHPYTGAVISRGTTSADGTYSLELPEGYYKVEVSADKHENYSNYCSINPGRTEKLVVNISYQPITVDWTVEETEIEDEYEIVTTVQYETNVPMPVVKINMPKSIDGDNMAVGDAVIINMLLTNVGLINAQDVTLNLPKDKTEWKFEALAYNDPFILGPQQMVTVPVKITRIADESQSNQSPQRRNAAGNMVNNYANCMAAMETRYKYLCGTELKNNAAAERMAMKLCAASASMQAIGEVLGGIFGGSGGGGGGGGLGSPGGGGNGGGGGGSSTTYNQVSQTLDICDPCDAARMENTINSALGFTWFGPINDALNDAAEGAQEKRNTGQYPGGKWYIKKIGERVFNAVTGVLLDRKLFDGASNFASLADGIYRVTTACDDIHTSNAPANAPTGRRASKHSWVEKFDEVALSYVNQVNLMESIMRKTFGDPVWYEDPDEQKAAFIRYVCELPDDVIPTDEELMAHKPETATLAQMRAYVNHVNGDSSTSPAVESIEEDLNEFLDMNEAAQQKGYTSMTDEFFSEYDSYVKHYEAMAASSVCATITLQFKQTMTMTRQAFRGKLIVFNGHESIPMKDVKLSLQVTDENGLVATPHEFQINAESLDGFNGALDFESGWNLEANATGTATVLFIPTKYAAPDKPVTWSFGGTLSYIDPFTGLEVTRELYPVPLTVKPSPELDLTYFMQRDVYGDDPLTLDVVEPMKPAEFALLINNKGNGDATNVRMVTQQPEIIENEKGLLIDFELISSQVNGKDAVLSFGKEIANDFGNIPAHSQMYAQWWLTSTLLGHFTDYKVEATHVTSYGNEDLSLLDQVTIHELIHSLEVNKDGNKLRGFMVNDIADADDLPDMLYLTNAETMPVSIAANAVVKKKSATEYQLTVTPSQAGWNYGNLYDPSHGISEIKSIVRQSDGKEIPLPNFWQTDRTLLDGKDWLYEYRLHFADDFADGTDQTYVLTFEPIPDVLLEVESIKGIPEENDIAIEPVDDITVNFNKEIKPETFTSDDLTMAVQGVKQDVSQIAITTEDNKKFSLDLSKLNEQLGNGYYTLTVGTADVTDFEGYLGKNGKQVGWIMFRGGLVQLLTKAWPDNSGTVSRKPLSEEAPSRRTGTDENTAEYGSTVILVATPENGYEFSNWTLNGEIVSTEQEFQTTALGDMDVVANFIKKSYSVEIISDSEKGTVSGAGTGIYEFGTQLHLTAEPGEDYKLKEWLVNDQPVDAGNGTLDITVDAATTVTAVFERVFYRQSITMAKGWNWVSSYLGESLDITTISDFVYRIVGQFDELIRDPQYGLVGGLTQLTAGEGFKIESTWQFTDTFRGHLFDVNNTPIQLHKGWNWLAYPYLEELPVSSAVKNAEEGDYLVAQTGFAEFAGGNWGGTIDTFVPGSGYLYKSASEKTLKFDFSAGTTGGNRAPRQESAAKNSNGINIHRYPNTMNMTIQLQQNGSVINSGPFNIYAMAGNELRGISQQIGDKHYLTVYGDVPVEVSFVVESADTGESYVATEVLTFCDDVVGNRKSPFVLHVGDATGISSLSEDGRPMTVYSLEGVLISRDSTLKALKQLPKGVYIVNGQKCFIK
jgi:hypothetical protein